MFTTITLGLELYNIYIHYCFIGTALPRIHQVGKKPRRVSPAHHHLPHPSPHGLREDSHVEWRPGCSWAYPAVGEHWRNIRHLKEHQKGTVNSYENKRSSAVIWFFLGLLWKEWRNDGISRESLFDFAGYLQDPAFEMMDFPKSQDLQDLSLGLSRFWCLFRASLDQADKKNCRISHQNPCFEVYKPTN